MLAVPSYHAIAKSRLYNVEYAQLPAVATRVKDPHEGFKKSK